jgi:hypothetical protein
MHLTLISCWGGGGGGGARRAGGGGGRATTRMVTLLQECSVLCRGSRMRALRIALTQRLSEFPCV